MSAFYLYDDARARRFEPFALTRPVGELRAGGALVRHRWEVALGLPCAGHLVAPHLAHFHEDGAPGAVTVGAIPAGSVIVNARALPTLAPLPPAGRWHIAGEVAAVRLAGEVEVSAFADGSRALAALDAAGAAVDAEGWWLHEVWDLVRHLAEMLRADVLAIAPSVTRADVAGTTVIGEHAVVVEQGAHVEPLVVFDVTAGPVLVRRGASVAAFTRLVGPCIVAEDAQVLGGKVIACSIGEHCRVHGEMSTTILVGHANKGHDGFVGHSVLGRWSNLGAATVTSNLKNTYGPVQLWTPTGVRETGMQFLGTLVGDHAKTAIGTRLTTGTVIGAGANVVASGLTAKVVAPFAWGDGASDYDLPKFVTVAERVMARRQVVLDERGKRHLESVFAARWRAGA